MDKFKLNGSYLVNIDKLKQEFGRTGNSTRDLEDMLRDIESNLQVEVVSEYQGTCCGWLVFRDECVKVTNSL